MECSGPAAICSTGRARTDTSRPHAPRQRSAQHVLAACVLLERLLQKCTCHLLNPQAVSAPVGPACSGAVSGFCSGAKQLAGLTGTAGVWVDLRYTAVIKPEAKWTACQQVRRLVHTLPQACAGRKNSSALDLPSKPDPGSAAGRRASNAFMNAATFARRCSGGNDVCREMTEAGSACQSPVLAPRLLA
jgi:hypothetical protein